MELTKPRLRNTGKCNIIFFSIEILEIISSCYSGYYVIHGVMALGKMGTFDWLGLTMIAAIVASTIIPNMALLAKEKIPR